MKTLFVSDLDGTLLRNDQKTSPFTNGVIARMVQAGYCFSYATARSIHTAKKATAGMEAAIPLIVYNGAFIVENGSGALLHGNYFEDAEADEICAALLEKNVQPIVYGFKAGIERMAYIKQALHPAAVEFLATRQGDKRHAPVVTARELMEGRRFYFTCIDEAEKLEGLYVAFRDKYRCVYARDIYGGAQWLEIMPKNASKANAVRQLQAMLNCDRVVAFGDGINDLDLFEMADEAYAVANAEEALKQKATAVIGSNEEDGVAKYLNQQLGLKMEGDLWNGTI